MGAYPKLAGEHTTLPAVRVTTRGKYVNAAHFVFFLRARYMKYLDELFPLPRTSTLEWLEGGNKHK